MRTKLDHLNEWATVGLLVAPTEFIETNMSTYTLEDSGGYGLNRKVEGRIVTYSYIPREHYGLETKASQDRTIYSSSTCIGGFIIDEDVYIDGEINNTIRKCSYLYTVI